MDACWSQGVGQPLGNQHGRVRLPSNKGEGSRQQSRLPGRSYIELPSKGVFTIKLDKYKVRIFACGNKTHETYGRISTTDLDTAMMRYLVSWGASSPDCTFASLDVTAAFLNAPLPEGRVVILKPPSILYKLQLMPPGLFG